MSNPVSLAAARQAKAASGQASRAKGFAARPGAVHRMRVVPVADKGEFMDWWAGLMRRRCGQASTIAQVFDRTEQTGRNWLAGFSCPLAHDLDLAMEMWPEEFEARYARRAMARAA